MDSKKLHSTQQHSENSVRTTMTTGKNISEQSTKKAKLTPTQEQMANSDTFQNTSQESIIHPDINLENSFEPLASHMDTDIISPNDENLQNTTNPNQNTNKPTTHLKQTRMPPIVVTNIPSSNFFGNNKKLQSLLTQPMKISYSSEGIKYHTACRKDYDILYNIFQTEKLKFYSHEPRETKLLQIVLKGLPTFIESDVIKTELELLNFNVEHVRQMTVPSNDTEGAPLRRRIPIWVVTLPNTEHSRTIYQLRDINNHIIKIESYRTSPHIIQCHKCQGFGHTSRRCNLQLRCVKCSQEHLFSDCPIKGPAHTPICANCNGAHTASYGQCPVQLERKNALREKLRNTQQFRRENRTQQPAWTSSDFPQLSQPAQPQAFETTFRHTTNTTLPPDSPAESFKDILHLLRSFNIFNSLRIIRSTLQKMQSTSDPLSKLIMFIEGITNLITDTNEQP